MNVCGGHVRSITTAGLRKAIPASIELVPGPGCPVCICPEEDIDEAILLALHERVILVAYGDMLRVPVNAPNSEPRSLEQAKAPGADVRPIASPLEAAKLASENPDRKVVFLAAGFETTTAPSAALLAQGAPQNLLFLMSGRRTWPAVAMLLDSGEPGFEALIAPGHVATVMGPEEWEFVPRDHGLPTAIAGFSPESLLCRRRHADADDDVARVSAEMLERILNTDIDRDGDGYVESLGLARDDRLLPGLGQVRSRYTVEMEDVPEHAGAKGSVPYVWRHGRVLRDVRRGRRGRTRPGRSGHSAQIRGGRRDRLRPLA